MRTKYIWLLLLAFPLFCFGQKEEIAQFINDVCKDTELVPPSFRYFNVVDSSFAIKFDEYSIDTLRDYDLVKNFLQNNPDFSVDEFVQKAKHSEIINWKNYRIEKAKIASWNSIPKLPVQVISYYIIPYGRMPIKTIDSLNSLNLYNGKQVFIVPAKRHWKQKRQDKECNKAMKRYLENIPNEDTRYYRFSTPIFPDDNKYAIMQIDNGGIGAAYVFKKINNKWVKIYTFNRWIA